MLESFIHWLLDRFRDLGYPGIVILMAIESSFLPLPSELVMPPAGYLAAHATLDRRRPLPVEHCVVIEDSLPGLGAARAAGMRCAMLTTSHPSSALAEAGADVVWTSFAGHDPAELLALVDR